MLLNFYKVFSQLSRFGLQRKLFYHKYYDYVFINQSINFFIIIFVLAFKWFPSLSVLYSERGPQANAIGALNPAGFY